MAFDKKEYMRTWREKNQERIKESWRLYSAKNKDKLRKVWTAANQSRKGASMCSSCGKPVYLGSGLCKSCATSGVNNGFWKGQKAKTYRRSKDNGSLHREIFEKNTGLKLDGGNVIHHIDEVKLNNDISNLLLFRSASAHTRWHMFLRRHGLKGLSFSQPWFEKA